MAPTEVLAEQHASSVRALLDGLVVLEEGSLLGERPLQVAVLTNRTRAAERRRVLAGMADGTIDLVIGTHALLSEGVEFHSLGVAVVDEQHRFGVEQRAALRGSGGGAGVPDLLVMTATPIPRTAAMTVYGDLDVSVLDELPPGRTPIETCWARDPDQELDAWRSVREQVAAGHRAYVVCPLIEGSDKLEVASAEQTFEQLSTGELSTLRLGLLHGRLPAEEKQSVMDAFRSGEIDVLVATTVIEVGVDVPEATVMVILDADRFGIAQLHQLRGRVDAARRRAGACSSRPVSRVPTERPGSRRWCAPPTGSSSPRWIWSSAARAPCWVGARRAATTCCSHRCDVTASGSNEPGRSPSSWWGTAPAWPRTRIWSTRSGWCSTRTNGSTCSSPEHAGVPRPAVIAPRGHVVGPPGHSVGADGGSVGREDSGVNAITTAISGSANGMLPRSWVTTRMPSPVRRASPE